MGAKRTKHRDLPPRMRRKGNAFYFDGFTADGRRTDIRLGHDYGAALAEWARLYGAKLPAAALLFATAADRYKRECLPLKAPATQKDNCRELDQLLPVFGQCAMESITTRDLATYRDLRQAKTRGNRELALFSHIYNMAREWGYTDKENPCRGLRKNKEKGRDRYITDKEFAALCAAAAPVMSRLLRIAYLTGQRPADVLKMRLTDIDGDCLLVTQNKTGAKIRIELTGQLGATVKECRAGRIGSAPLVADGRGKALSINACRRLFEQARESAGVSCQLRDVRAKAASDIDSAEDAQRLLGHSSVTMTEHYRRDKLGKKAKPTR